MQSKLNARLREGIKRFLKQGYTIRSQKAKHLNQVYRYVKQKFPDADFPDRYIRTLLVPKLNRGKTNLTKKKKKLSKKEVDDSINMLSKAAVELQYQTSGDEKKVSIVLCVVFSTYFFFVFYRPIPKI